MEDLAPFSLKKKLVGGGEAGGVVLDQFFEIKIGSSQVFDDLLAERN